MGHTPVAHPRLGRELNLDVATVLRVLETRRRHVADEISVFELLALSFQRVLSLKYIITKTGESIRHAAHNDRYTSTISCTQENFQKDANLCTTNSADDLYQKIMLVPAK